MSLLSRKYIPQQARYKPLVLKFSQKRGHPAKVGYTIVTRKVKVFSLSETIKGFFPSSFQVNFSCIVSGSERTFTFRVSLNTLPTLATLVQDCYLAVIKPILGCVRITCADLMTTSVLQVTNRLDAS